MKCVNQESKCDWRKLFSLICHSIPLCLLYPKARGLAVESGHKAWYIIRHWKVQLTEDIDEVTLINLARTDPEAFGALYERYVERIYNYVFFRVGNSIDAEDLTSKVFFRALKSIGGYKHMGLPFSAWIYRIAHNQVISNFRKRQARPEAYSMPIDSPGFQLLADDIALDNQSDINLRQVLISKALQKIEAKYREILVLKFFEDKSYQEISDILKKPSGTVASLLNRAKKSLKNHLPEKDKI